MPDADLRECERYTSTGRFAALLVLALSPLACSVDRRCCCICAGGERRASHACTGTAGLGGQRVLLRRFLALWIALASPIDALDDYLLTAHMIQHFILMSVAPPLIVLGAPMVPLLAGTAAGRHSPAGCGRCFARDGLERLCDSLTHPVFAWIAMNVAYLGWHVPAAFELTFRHEWIHDFEHVCFLRDFARDSGGWCWRRGLRVRGGRDGR